jgi:GTP-binding protein
MAAVRALPAVRVAAMVVSRAMGRRSFSSDAAAGSNARRRNVAVIAHVDHGKTTLMDKLMNHEAASSSSSSTSPERAMDSRSLEKERGITIQAKYTSFAYGGYVVNAVDTPGHADFGGEVERALDMVDGVLVLVDASEGPMAQTKFVLRKALQKGLKPVVVLNKVDRDGVNQAGCDAVETNIFDLVASLGANDEQLDFPVCYASARAGVASTSLAEAREQIADRYWIDRAHTQAHRRSHTATERARRRAVSNARIDD